MTDEAGIVAQLRAWLVAERDATVSAKRADCLYDVVDKLDALLLAHATSFENLDKMQADIDAHATASHDEDEPPYQWTPNAELPAIYAKKRHAARVREIAAAFLWSFGENTGGPTVADDAEQYVQQREREEQK